MKPIDVETPPEEGLTLGRELERFRASTRAILVRAFAGPVLLLAASTVLAWQALAERPLSEPRWPLIALAVAAVLLSLRGIRPFVAIVLLRLRVHEHGFVLRSEDGTRAALWEAVQEIRTARDPSGAVALGVRLVHGETVEIAEDIAELRSVEARLRAAVGEKFCS